jgi:ketosteroid isomerase-like protein
MAEHPDVTLVKRGYEAFNAADVDTLTELIADDAVQTMVGNNLVSGEFKGRDSILGMYGKIAELTNGTYSVAVEQTFTDGNGTVVVVHRQTAERNGRRLDNRQALVFRIVGGKVVSLTDTSDDIATDDAFYS